MTVVFSVVFMIALCVKANSGMSGEQCEPHEYEYLSPQSLVADESAGLLYIAATTAKRISIFDVKAGKVAREIHLPVFPCGLALSSDTKTLYVTETDSRGRLWAIDCSSGKVEWSIEVGHSPVSATLTANGRRMYVCDRFSNSISVVDLAAREVVETIPVGREPVDAVLSLDGRTLFVVNSLPDGAANKEHVAAEVSVINTETNRVLKSIEMPNGSTGLKNVCLSPDGKWAYVTHILARYQVPTTQVDRGWQNTNALSIIDVASGELYQTVLLDDIYKGFANPWAVSSTADGKNLCVTSAGSHELTVIDRQAMHDKLDGSSDDVRNDLSFLAGLRKRLELNGRGPRGMVILGRTAYITEYFSGSLAKVELAGDDQDDIVSISLGDEKQMSPQRRGEMLFNDATMCFQNWQSCASCHPDARSDGLNWDLLNDGIGNPKSTKSMLLAHMTPPVMVSGIRPNAETAVRAGIRYIQFAARPEEDAAAIDEYLKSIEPTPSPYLVDGGLSESARRGKEIFRSAKCGRCHSGEMFTDLKSHDVGTGSGTEKGIRFDTPTLVEVWRTAPYLYDGRAATIRELLTRYNNSNMHGVTADLSDKELDALSEYVLSL
ncbi:c-type cytochrome [Anaerohalosphaera lusitana]|nr:c-type cytochrome [Anaerohalosphaera lusitana]